MLTVRSVYILCAFLAANVACGQTYFETVKGDVHFSSSSQNEIIKATSNELQGVIDLSKNQFAFKVTISSFMGFNSPLQKEHFNENYMESYKFPEATFTGKIIEDVSFNENGKYMIRAKGKLTIHGKSQERIIYTDVTVKDQLILFGSNFIVALSDHDIKIPRVVHTKLATEINVTIKGEMMPKR